MLRQCSAGTVDSKEFVEADSTVWVEQCSRVVGLEGARGSAAGLIERSRVDVSSGPGCNSLSRLLLTSR